MLLTSRIAERADGLWKNTTRLFQAQRLRRFGDCRNGDAWNDVPLQGAQRNDQTMIELVPAKPLAARPDFSTIP